MIKTLIVDDSPLVRSIIRDFLESEGSFQILDEAENGEDGVKKAQMLQPDLITMDIEMPKMNGLEATGEITKTLSSAIVVITTLDTAKMAYDATVKGAMEFYAKDLFTSQMSKEKRDEIFNTLKQIVSTKKTAPIKPETAAESIQDTKNTASVSKRDIQSIVIASSTGGPMALCQLLTNLPKDFPVPITLVQHNTTGFDKGFVQWLNGYTQLDVCLAEEGTIPTAGNVYVAPTDKHLVMKNSIISFDESEPVNNQKPAADLLFKTAAELYGSALVSVVLTGMGCDGAEGTRYVKQAGGITIAQDEASSMIYGMPQAAFETGCVDMVLPLGAIAEQLLSLVKK